MPIENSISVVLPVYNEQDNINHVIKSIFNTLPSITNDIEVFAVDDGSSDKTPEILKELQSSESRLRVVRHEKNKGYGAALISGFKNAKNELILMMDSDRQFKISEIKKFIPYVADFDIVAGFRIKRRDSSHRYLFGAVFNFITNVFFGIRTRDINCGFKLFKTDLLHNMSLTMEGALINAEIMILAKRNRVKIKEVGINHYPRVYGKQTGASFKVIFKAILSMFHLMCRLRLK